MAMRVVSRAAKPQVEVPAPVTPESKLKDVAVSPPWTRAPPLPVHRSSPAAPPQDSQPENDSEGGWGEVVDLTMTEMENLSQQIEEAEAENRLESASEPTDPDAEELAEEAANGLQSVMDRVQNFQRQQLEMKDKDQTEQDDPFWIASFYEVIETLAMQEDSANDLARLRVDLLSGCTGMLAEGWVLKAGLFPKPSKCRAAIIDYRCILSCGSQELINKDRAHENPSDLPSKTY